MFEIEITFGDGSQRVLVCEDYQLAHRIAAQFIDDGLEVHVFDKQESA